MGVITLSSGDNFLAGPEFSASLEKGVPYCDSILISLIGVVGAATEKLPFISSPRGVAVGEVAPAVQAEIDKLTRDGVNKIILISHLQSVDEDLALLKKLSGLDIAIAGGGDEVLANPGDLVVPGDVIDPSRPYPLEGKDAQGNFVPVVTTAGNYKYLGRLVVAFNSRGELIEVDRKLSGPIRVAGGDHPDAVFPEPQIQKLVVEPVEATLAKLGAAVVGRSEVALDGVRVRVRTTETNLGDLIADSQLWQATQLAADFGAPTPNVAIQNGGGIRNDNLRAPGEITELDTFDILPFSNIVCIVPNIPPHQFKEILENAVLRKEYTDGRFAQISGFKLVYDPTRQAQLLDGDGNFIEAGQRVISVVLDSGTVIVEDGSVVAGAPSVNIATIDFLARGGDQYPYRGAPFFNLGVSYQQALLNYIQDGLGGTTTGTAYPEGGEGRISKTQP